MPRTDVTELMLGPEHYHWSDLSDLSEVYKIIGEATLELQQAYPDTPQFVYVRLWFPEGEDL